MPTPKLRRVFPPAQPPAYLQSAMTPRKSLFWANLPLSLRRSRFYAPSVPQLLCFDEFVKTGGEGGTSSNSPSLGHPVYNDAGVVKANFSLDVQRPTSSPQKAFVFARHVGGSCSLMEILFYVSTRNPAVDHHWRHQPSIRQLLPDSRLRSPDSPSGGGLPTQATGPATASHRMTRACPHVRPAPHTSTPGGASNTTAPPAAPPPSPWPRFYCPCLPTNVCRPASARHLASPPTARLPPAKTASDSTLAC